MTKMTRSAAVLLWMAAMALSGCSGGSGDPAGSRIAGVSMAASQQGQSGGIIDYDGDGIDDLVVGAPYARGYDTVGALLIYRGTPGGFAEEPTWTLTGDDNFGCSFTGLGDLDGDGKPEFAVGAYNGDGAGVSMAGSVTIYKGGSTGRVIARLSGDDAMDKFGLVLKGGCDLNGDGVKDIVVGAPYHSPGPDRYQGGAAYVYFGPDFREADRVKIPATTATTGLGNAMTCGDLNGDGIGDLVIGATGKVLVYYGGPGFAPATDSQDVKIISSDGKFGSSMAVLGDLDDDGFNELVIAAQNATVNIAGGNRARAGRVYVVKGGTGNRTINLPLDAATATPNPMDDLLTWIDGAAYFDRFGFAVAPAGDVDGDGIPDLAVSAIFADRDGAVSIATGLSAGKVYLLRGKDLKTDGSATPIGTSSVFNGPGYNMRYGSFLCPFTKNGPKLLIGAPTVNRQAGSVYGVSLEAGSTAVPVFSAGGPGNSTTDGDCCGIAAARAPAPSPAAYDATDFTVDGRKWQPPPTGHAPGRDNGPGEAVHQPGEDCGICHTPGGRGGNKVWTMSGTVYDSRAARFPLAGAEVIFQNISGRVFSMTTNEVGNFWTDKPFFSNPANTGSGNWNYKAWVRYGNVSRPMVSLAPVGGMTSSARMSCSMHHAGIGSRGGLWALSAPTLKSYPATGLSYRKHIFPILRSKCAPCHIPGDSTARAPASEPLYDFSSGLDLMTYEGSSVTASGRTWSKAGIRDKINTSAPAASPILLKTLNGSIHGGGSFWSSGDADYRAILRWIAEGAQKN
jgi:hypothetical protein